MVSYRVVSLPEKPPDADFLVNTFTVYLFPFLEFHPIYVVVFEVNYFT